MASGAVGPPLTGAAQNEPASHFKHAFISAPPFEGLYVPAKQAVGPVPAVHQLPAGQIPYSPATTFFGYFDHALVVQKYPSPQVPDTASRPSC